MNTKIKENKYEKTALIMLVFSVIASGFNYLFQIVAGRFLNTADYGVLNSVFSFSSIVSVLGSALGMSIAKNLAVDDSNTIGKVKKLLLIAACIFPAYITVLVFVMHLLKYSLLTCVLASVSIYFLSVAYIFYGALQGKEMFFKLSVFNLFQPVTKFFLGMVLLAVGIKYNFVFVVITLGCIFSMIYGYITLKGECIDESPVDFSKIKPILKYLLFTIISTACLTFYNNVDVLLIRQYFPEDTVGLFSCAAVFGKIILYIPSILVTMLVPVAAKNDSNSKGALVKTLIYSLLISIAASVGLFVFRNLIIKLLMGEDYLPAAKFIMPTVAYIIPLVLVTALVNYLIARGDKYFTNAFCIIAGAGIILSAVLFHNTVEGVLYAFAVVYSILFIILMIRGFVKLEK